LSETEGLKKAGKGKAGKSGPFMSLKSWGKLVRGRIPGQVVIQYTDRCNAACAQCGMRASNRFERSKLDKDEVKRLLDDLAAKGVQSVSFTGGEPLLYFDEVAELAAYARAAGIRYVRTGTNGFIFKGHERADFEKRMAEMAGKLVEARLHTFWVSVDSAEAEAHEKNRGLPGVVKGMEKALRVFHDNGFHPAANLGINRMTGGREAAARIDPAGPFEADSFYEVFRKSFGRFYEFVESLGFTTVNACYPMSFEEERAGGSAVYAATSADDFIRFSDDEKSVLFRSLYDTLPEYRGRLRIFTPRSSLLAMTRAYNGGGPGYACRGGIDFFFIDAANMDTFPCGYRGSENLGKFTDLDLDSLDSKAFCKLCDWECFRDPSELFGPVLDALRRPVALARKAASDREFFREWLTDLRYYRACNYFSALEPPDRERMKAFGT
jgi:uncharacterized Fe-S cluster-containing radical SAM superfamily protein